ncbi:MAG: 23S rRNA (guanosine(2251)-2'-O)-methyltransferase RlmB [Candidatus Howiella sp.]|jgi:23S rRNA (guanosine2251-2'-O)-methyltransferase
MTRQERHQPDDTIIIGRNAVTEALRSGRELDKLFIAHGSSGTVQAIVAKCVQRGVVVKEVPPAKLDFLSGGGNHQGVVLMAAAHAYATVEDMLRLAEERGEPPFLLLCDEIEDPHNLGAIIRTAEAAGAHGVIIPKRRAATLTSAVAKAACGALEYLPVAKVTNLAAEIDELKARGLWIYGAEMDGSPWCQTDWAGPVALVIGSEGKGLGALVRKKCDGLVSMPMLGKINSLNASVAAGILMYEVARQRQGISAFAKR